MGIGVSTLGVAYFLTGLVILGFLYTPLTRPDTPGSGAFAVTVCGCALWPLSLSAGLLLEADTVASLAWGGRLVAPTVLTVGWLLLALRIASGRTPSQRVTAALAGYVVIELVVLATNPIHHVGFDPAVVAGDPGMMPDWNTWFWVQATINYVLMGTATLVLALEAIRATGLRRRQSALLTAAVIPTAIANLVTIAGVVDVPHDLSPFGFVGSAVIMYWAIYRAEFLDIVPIARQTALEELPHAVVTLDRDGRVVDYNAVARRYFDDTGIGTPAREFFAKLPEESVDALLTGETSQQHVRIRTDDVERRFDCAMSALGPSDERDGRVVVFSEVTDRIRREQRLFEQSERLSEFAEIVSHDIQGPLMELRSSATIAVQTDDASRVERVLDAADRMDRLVDDLVDLAHSGRQIDDPSPVSLATVAERAWDSVWTPAAELSVETEQTIEADTDRLQQLLENCFRNAVEHGTSAGNGRKIPDRTTTGHAPTIDQATSTGRGTSAAGTAPDGGVSVTIRSISGGFAIDDDGPGIPPERRSRVFDRGHTSSSDGTGLGLAIVKQIATAHGWSVAVDESPSGGARFALTNVTIAAERDDPSNRIERT